jgi:hypothetical protein
MPKLEEDGSGGNMDPTMFRQLIGSLRYLCQSRSDINYAVGYVRRFMNWYGDKVDRRRTSGYLFKFQNASVCWCSKKQPIIALSSCEAKYVAGSLATCQANWLQSLLSEMNIIEDITGVLKIDNKPEIT